MKKSEKIHIPFSHTNLSVSDFSDFFFDSCGDIGSSVHFRIETIGARIDPDFPNLNSKSLLLLKIMLGRHT